MFTGFQASLEAIKELQVVPTIPILQEAEAGEIWYQPGGRAGSGA